MTEVYWAPMGRCDRCGQFMKRGLMNWADHSMVCKGKPKPALKSSIQFTPVTQAAYDGLQASKSYFENH